VKIGPQSIPLCVVS